MNIKHAFTFYGNQKSKKTSTPKIAAEYKMNELKKEVKSK